MNLNVNIILMDNKLRLVSKNIILDTYITDFNRQNMYEEFDKLLKYIG